MFNFLSVLRHRFICVADARNTPADQKTLKILPRWQEGLHLPQRGLSCLRIEAAFSCLFRIPSSIVQPDRRKHGTGKSREPAGRKACATRRTLIRGADFQVWCRAEVRHAGFKTGLPWPCQAASKCSSRALPLLRGFFVYATHPAVGLKKSCRTKNNCRFSEPCLLSTSGVNATSEN
jgi:hypothetical protein